MKKRLLAAAALAAFSASAIVQADSTTPCDFIGFYAGISGGATYTIGKQNISSPTTFNQSNTTTINLINNNHVAQVHGTGGINLGYSYVWGWFYLGAELGGYYAPAHLTQDSLFSLHTTDAETGTPRMMGDLTVNSKLKVKKWEWTADLMPGVLLCDSFLLFGRVGVTYNKMNLQTNSLFHITSATNLPPFDLSFPLLSSSNKNRAALRLGLGLSHYISDNIVLNANYIYTYYGKVDLIGETPITIPQGARQLITRGLNSNANIRVQRYAFTLGLNYYFGNLFN